jgi:trehalose-6-phosphate synthase
VREKLLNDHNCLPVFLTDELVSKYYNGFCNGVLWPLFHYVPLPMYKAGGERKFDTDLWEAYKEANQLFAEAVVSIYQPKTDLVIFLMMNMYLHEVYFLFSSNDFTNP